MLHSAVVFTPQGHRLLFTLLRGAAAALLVHGAGGVVDVVRSGAVAAAGLNQDGRDADAAVDGDVLQALFPQHAALGHTLHRAARVVTPHQVVGRLQRPMCQGHWMANYRRARVPDQKGISRL